MDPKSVVGGPKPISRTRIIVTINIMVDIVIIIVAVMIVMVVMVVRTDRATRSRRSDIQT